MLPYTCSNKTADPPIKAKAPTLMAKACLTPGRRTKIYSGGTNSKALIAYSLEASASTYIKAAATYQAQRRCFMPQTRHKQANTTNKVAIKIER